MSILDAIGEITRATSGVNKLTSGVGNLVSGKKSSEDSEDSEKGKGILEILSTVASLTSGIGTIGSFATGLIGGVLNAGEAEKAQKYQQEWAEKIYADQLKQQAVQNKLAQEQLDVTKTGQYFNNELALRNEARQNTADWHTYMQNAANKYADVLNKSRALRKSNAEALRNR